MAVGGVVPAGFHGKIWLLEGAILTQFHDLSKTEARYLPKLRDLPTRKIAWSLACLLGACSLLAIFFYVEYALPQGPAELPMWPGGWVFLGAAALIVASWVIAVQFKDAWMHRRIGLALLRYLDHQLNIHFSPARLDRIHSVGR